MDDYRALLERSKAWFPVPDVRVERILRAGHRRRRNRRLVAGAVGIAIAIVAISVGSSVVRSGQQLPAEEPQLRFGRIAIPIGDRLMLLDPRTGERSDLNLRTGQGGYTVTGFTWSPDGTKFAYVTEQQGTVRVFDLKTNTISQIVPCEAPAPYHQGCARFVAWSPDGSRIAVSGARGLELVDPDGTNPSTLIDLKLDRDGYVGPATWSPDGRTLAFTASLPSARDLQAIYEVNADGSDLRTLFEQPGSATVSQPRWSPDGSTIAYLVAAHGPGYAHTPVPPIIPQVWIVGTDGSHPTELFSGGACCSGGNWTGLSWAPDGTRIAFISTPPGSPYGTKGSRLYAIDPATGHAQVMARQVPLAGPPAWQPGP